MSRTMLRDDQWRGSHIALATVTLALVLLINGAIPFVANPDYQISFWVAGFAESIANQNLLSLRATDIGYPSPAPMAFGLPQAYLTAAFIKLGMFPSDAYTMTMVVFLGVAFFGCHLLAARLDIDPVLATFGAALWFSLPIIRAHQGFGPLIAGIAMLPFYLTMALSLLDASHCTVRCRLRRALFYGAIVLLALFTDGYSFVMFASSASMLVIYRFWATPESRTSLATYVLPVHVVAFALAYAAYALYVGRSSYGPMSLGPFRYFASAWGYLFVPTEGISWILDQWGLSVARSIKTHIGDETVWRTSFSAPLVFGVLFLGGWNAFVARRGGGGAISHVIALARENAAGRGLSPSLFEARSIYDLEAGRDSADLVVCCEVLEHLEHPEAGLQELQRVVGRHLIVSVPREPLWCALNLARGKYIADWGNTPGHIQHWSKSSFIRMVSKYFEVVEVKSPLPWTMLLCRPRG